MFVIDEEFTELDVEAIMDQEFYCHRCEEEGLEQELQTVFYTEEVESYRPGMQKVIGVAEKGCPRPEHVDVEFKITESFYTSSE